jgi:hypothetical protein
VGAGRLTRPPDWWTDDLRQDEQDIQDGDSIQMILSNLSDCVGR